MILLEGGLPAINSEYINLTFKMCQKIVEEVVASSKYADVVEGRFFKDIEYKWNRTSHSGGYLKHPDGDGIFVLTLNEAFNRNPDDMTDEEFDKFDSYLRNTILHEMCHYVVAKIYLGQGRFIWKHGTIGYNPIDHTVKSEYGQNAGHNRLWREIADMVGAKSGQDITRYMSDAEFDAVGMTAALKAKSKYEVACPKCHATWKYQRMCNTVEFPSKYKCGRCHVPLVRTK